MQKFDINKLRTTLKQVLSRKQEIPNYKRYISYVLGFVVLSLIIYLSIPFFFNYLSIKDDLEKKIYNNFGITVILSESINYNFIPSPRLTIKDSKLLSFSGSSKNIGEIKKIIFRIPFKDLVNVKKIDFNFAEFVNAEINFEEKEFLSFHNYLLNNVSENKVHFRDSKINLINNGLKIFSAPVEKLSISSKHKFSNVVLHGKIFNSAFKVNYRTKIRELNPSSTLNISFPKLGFNLNSNIIYDKKADVYSGSTRSTLSSNQFFFNYKLKDNVFKITNSNIKSRYFNGNILGNLFLSPFLVFDFDLNIKVLKFNKLIAELSNKHGNFLKKIIPFNDKINGKLNIKISKIKSNSKIINKGKVGLEFQNGNLIINKADLNINKIGSIEILGKIFKQKKAKIFSFKSKVAIDKPKIFYSRFLIPEEQRKEITKAEAIGKINLNNFEITFDQITYGDNYRLKQPELKNFFSKINSFISKNLSIDLLNKSNFSSLVRIFFD